MTTPERHRPPLGRIGWLAIVAFLAACVFHWLHTARMQKDIHVLEQRLRAQEHAQAFSDFQANYIPWRFAQKRPGDFDSMLSHINTQTAASGQNLFQTMIRDADPTDKSSISLARSTLGPVLEFFNAGWSPEEAKRMQEELSALQR
jgi:hypothetical protein